jgi:hypothetical protein
MDASFCPLEIWTVLAKSRSVRRRPRRGQSRQTTVDCPSWPARRPAGSRPSLQPFCATVSAGVRRWASLHDDRRQGVHEADGCGSTSFPPTRPRPAQVARPAAARRRARRHVAPGAGRSARAMHPVSLTELERLARECGATVIHTAETPDQMGRPNVTWTGIALRLPDDGTGALPLLRHVILNDQKSATYKLGCCPLPRRRRSGRAGTPRRQQRRASTWPDRAQLGAAYQPLVAAGLPQAPAMPARKPDPQDAPRERLHSARCTVTLDHHSNMAYACMPSISGGSSSLAIASGACWAMNTRTSDFSEALRWRGSDSEGQSWRRLDPSSLSAWSLRACHPQIERCMTVVGVEHVQLHLGEDLFHRL